MNEASSTAAAAVATIVARHRLAWHRRRHRGRIGGQRGFGSGSSQEFHDFRDYAAGDDLRHVDWRGFARTEQLRVRLYEAEVAPYCDVVVDPSASMAVTPEKLAAAHALAAAFVGMARAEQAQVGLQALGRGPRTLADLAFDAPQTTPERAMAPLRAGGVRILLTDGLWTTGPGSVVASLAAGAAHFLCVQLLDPWELAPTVGDVLQLVDCETGERQERRLDAATVAAYGSNLHRLVAELRGAVAAVGGTFASVTAGPIAEMFARDLLPPGVVEPA